MSFQICFPRDRHEPHSRSLDAVDHAIETILKSVGIGAASDDVIRSVGWFDQRIGLLESALASLQAKLLLHIARTKSRRNSALAISRLPVELFIEIAAQFLDDPAPPYDRPQRMRTLMLVSTEWYGIVDRTPALWSLLNPDFPLRYTSMALIKSRSSDLDISQPLDSHPKASHSYATFLGLVLPELPRWHVAHIVSPPVLDERSLRYLSQPAPKLTAFSLNLSSRRSNDVPHQSIDLFGGCAPRLRDLEVVAVPILATLAILRGLTTLSISFPADTNLSPLDILQVLEHCPELAQLRLNEGNSFTDRPTTSGRAIRPIHLPKLLQLALDFLDMDIVSSLFDGMISPNCVKLKLTYVFFGQHLATAILYNLDLTGCPVSQGHPLVRYFAFVPCPSRSRRLGHQGLPGPRRFPRPKKAIFAAPDVSLTSGPSMSRVMTTVAAGTRSPRRSETVSRVPRATRLQIAQTIRILDPRKTSAEVTVGGEDFCLHLDFHDYKLSWTFDWLMQIVPGLKEKAAQVEFEGLNIGDTEVLGMLDERITVVALSTPSDGDRRGKVEALLEYLAAPIFKPNAIQWPLPHLRELVIRTEAINPSTILQMVKKRYGVTNCSPTMTLASNAPRRFELLYISKALPDEESRREITKLVGGDVVVWKDEDGS